MIGKPGCGIYQMNGQPTAQNNRETGCNGEYPGFRNSQNPEHMADLARHWNIDVDKIPHVCAFLSNFPLIASLTSDISHSGVYRRQ
jgi:anaerobic selenocysteine-containing dehydrogenase